MKRRAAGNSERGRYETSPPKFSAFGCGRGPAAGRVTDRMGASLSVAPGYNDSSVCSRRGNRRCRPHRRRAHGPHARPADCDSKHCRCRWNDRLDPRDARDADGYTILMGHMGTHATSVALYPALAYKPEIDFEPIGMVSEVPQLLVARKDFAPKDLREFVAFVKTNSDKLNVGHAGVGSIFFSNCLMLNSILDVKPTQVPFNGGAPAMNALVGGQIDYMCADVVTAAPQLQAGTIKAYAIASTSRNPSIPTVPTTTEAGLPEFQASGWFAPFAPKGTPKPILDRLTDALDRALDDERTRKRLIELANDLPEKSRRGQQALRVFLKNEIARWTPIIQAASVKAE